MIAQHKRIVIEDNISNEFLAKTECEVNFGKLSDKDESDEHTAEEREEQEFCLETSAALMEKPDTISEAKIMRRMDTLQDTDDNGENTKVETSSSTENNNKVEGESLKDVTPEVETTVESDKKVLPTNSADIAIKVNLVNDVESSQQKKPSSPKKRLESNRRRANKQHQEEVLNNYDIIDRTEAKKLQADGTFSFANVFGRFKKAFTSQEPPKRLLEDNDSHPFMQSSVVNLSIEQTKSGEQMQVNLFL